MLSTAKRGIFILLTPVFDQSAKLPQQLSVRPKCIRQRPSHCGHEMGSPVIAIARIGIAITLNSGNCNSLEAGAPSGLHSCCPLSCTTRAPCRKVMRDAGQRATAVPCLAGGRCARRVCKIFVQKHRRMCPTAVLCLKSRSGLNARNIFFKEARRNGTASPVGNCCNHGLLALAERIGRRSSRGLDLNNPSKYSIVFMRPSRSCTRGAHASSFCARLISGQRCLGSSSGSGR
jgi:hypothetical protein